MNYFDLLPTELLHVIAQDSEPAYKALLVYPRFARAFSYDKRLDYMVGFGHNVRVRHGPALIYRDGEQRWYRDDKPHRDNGPAIIYANGDERWYRNGELHRDYGPAVIYTNGDEEWRQNGELHRDYGPAVILVNGGTVMG